MSLGFPIVLSNGPPDAAGLQRVADAGVTMIRTGRGDWTAGAIDAQIAAERARLDAAAAHGLQCWVWLGALTNLAPGASDGALRRVVDALRTHPALGAWKGHDEPGHSSVPPENLARGYRVVSSLDPAHPLVIIQAPRGSSDALVPYRPAFDIGGADIYPVSYPGGIHSDLPNNDLSLVGDVTQWIRHAAGTKPVWVTLQIAWSGVLPPDHVPRFPSNHDLRFMAYQAIANGARGLAFFGGHLKQVMSPADASAGWNWTFWTESLEPLVRELSSTALGPALTARSSQSNVHTQPHSADVEMATRQTARFLYVAAVRRGGSPSRIGIAGLPAAVRAGQVLFEYDNQQFRSVSVSGGAFRDWFAPHDAHVYRFAL
ncbi:MAG: hypothetical protein ACJ77E_19805 [Gaiellaceae bacterium]